MSRPLEGGPLAIVRRRRACPEGRASQERGAATVFVVGMMIILFAAAGLAIDGGRAINARAKAIDSAEQAARAGAAAVDVATLRNTGEVRIDTGAADTVARRYLNNAGYLSSDYEVDAQPGSVRVFVGFEAPTIFMGVIGVNNIPVSGEATAGPVTGFGG